MSPGRSRFRPVESAGVGMTKKSTIKRRLLAAAAVTAAASFLALMGAPASAQFFPFFGGPYQQPVERPQPPADYSKAPAAKKPETPPTSTVVVMGDSMADWLAYGLEDAFSDTPEIGIVRKQKPLSGLIRYESRSDLEWSSVARDIMNTEKPAVAVMILGLSDRGPIRERPGAKPAPAAAPAQGGSPAQPEAVPPGADSSELQITAPEQPKGRGSSNEFRSEIWAELYSKRIAETIAAMKSRGVPVLWVGLPIIRGPKATSDALYLNELYRAQAEKAGIIYVDVWDGFVDEGGKFASSGPDVDGQTRRLRTPDGVYFTKYGARKLAHFVEREIRRVINSRALPVSLPLDTQPSAPARPAGPVARPVAGAVLPLASGPAPASEELAGGGPARASATDPIAARVLVKGEPVSPLKGRADDFVWKGGGMELPAANMIAEPGTIKPVDPAAATAASGEEKPQTEAQAAVQPPKKPRPPAPVQQQRPFFSPFGFFR
jgi:hypothetical protein